MNYNEQRLQMQCVSWFRAQYPQYAMLLTHPINEGGRNTARTGGMHKAEGTVAGVPDLLFFMSAEYRKPMQGQNIELIITYHGLGIELKTAKGRQSQEQKDFQKMFETAGYKYVVVRSFDEFQKEMNDYIGRMLPWTCKIMSVTHAEITKAAEAREKEKFYKIIGKK